MKLKHFHLASKLAKKSDHRQHKLGAVITKGNKVLGIGFNKNKTSPKSNNEFNTLHAEISCILNTDEEDLEGSEIYIYRQTKSGKLGLSKPCPACEHMLKSVGIKIVYYTSPEGYVEESYE